MAARLKLFSQEQLEAALTIEVVRQTLDDDRDGEADAAALQRVQEYASTYVLTGLSRVYPKLIPMVQEWQSDLNQVPIKLLDLALDVATAWLAKRHPTYVRRDYKGLYAHVDAALERIRAKGLDSLGIDTAPEPAINQGGDVFPIGAPVEVNEPVFSGPCGMGDF